MMFGVACPTSRKRREKWGTPINLSLSQRSIEMKAYFHADQDTYRVAVLHGRVKTPLLDSFNCSCIQSESQSADDANISWIALIVDDQAKNAHSLRLGVARFLGIFRIRRGNGLRS
jgi:hypothetical protein